MTKFIAYYNLCPVYDTKEFLGLSPDSDSANIIATLGRNIAMVIKISTQKQIKSWSVLEKFSCKVVYDHRSQKYVGVFANRFVRQWDEGVSDINKCKKLKFHKNIVDLIYDSNETLVLYADGTCESLSSAIQSRKEHAGSYLQVEMLSTNPMLDAKIIKLEGGRKFLTYFQNDKTDTLELVKKELDLSNLKPVGKAVKFSLRRGKQEVTVSGYSVIESENSHALLTIWADGRVFLLNLVDNVDSQKSPGQFVSMFTDLKVDTPLTVLALSKHCVAIYGANSTQEGGSLLLYNTQFKVVKAKQFFKIYFNFSRLWSMGASILLAMGQNLSVVSYQMSKEMLSDLVGSQICNDFSHGIESEFINEEEELEEQIILDEILNPPPEHIEHIKPEKEKEKEKKQVSEAVFADGKTIPFKSDEQFHDELSNLLNRDMHVELIEVDSEKNDIEVNLMSNYFDSGFITEDIRIIANQLEQCGAGEHEISEKLLWVLLKTDLVEDIAVCLRRYSSIPERILVKTLKYILQDFKVDFGKEIFENHLNNGDHMEVDIQLDKEDISDFPNVDLLSESHQITAVKKRKDLMKIILSCSFDTQAISVHIRNELDYNEVVKMLEYLYILITSNEPCLEERPDCPDKKDDDLRILRWFGIFLNSHFQKMSLSKDLHLCDILLKWHDVFCSYKKQISELVTVTALLYNIVEKKQISKEKNYSKWYSIEEVRLY